MNGKTLRNIEDLGEESGREEAACHFSDFPDAIDSSAYSRLIQQHGRGYAQGLYRLRGKAAKVFALHWRMGYFASYDMFKREGHLNNPDEED